MAPIKNQPSIAKLELCSALLLAETYKAARASIRLDVEEVRFWSDSKIALAWLKKEPTLWQVYVRNRVAKIQAITKPDDWYHVRGKENPADVASRGCAPHELVGNPLWWEGPTWLKQEERCWPAGEEDFVTDEERSSKEKIVATAAKSTFMLDFVTRFSAFLMMVKVMAYMLRVGKRMKEASLQLAREEINRAQDIIGKGIQWFYFGQEIKALQDGVALHKKSRLYNLNPVLDSNKVLRIGSRLRNARIKHSAKFPAILPKENYLSKLIMREAHADTLLGGVSLTLARSRQKFWIIRGKDLAKEVVKACVKCARYNAEPFKQQMGSLPPCRVNASRPFTHVGIDYAGPITLKFSPGRGAKTFKGYIAVFVCMAVKAIHLEAVSDLTAEAFLAAFRRFTALRGLPSDVYSDNGGNFVKANKILKVDAQKMEEKVNKAIANKGIKWHFIPPHAPHMGGLWEAGVKSMKHHLKRIVGSSILTFEELSTTLYQISASLNSRPLIPMSEDPEDCEAITPGHFLIGAPMTLPPEPSLLEENLSYQKRWKLSQRLQQGFWKQWNAEYLSRIHNRSKWNRNSENIKLGQLVLIKEDNQGPTEWLMGRVTRLFPGEDKKVRVVELLTKNREHVKRPITKLCALPEEEAAETYRKNLEEIQSEPKPKPRRIVRCNVVIIGGQAEEDETQIWLQEMGRIPIEDLWPQPAGLDDISLASSDTEILELGENSEEAWDSAEDADDAMDPAHYEQFRDTPDSELLRSPSPARSGESPFDAEEAHLRRLMDVITPERMRLYLEEREVNPLCTPPNIEPRHERLEALAAAGYHPRAEVHDGPAALVREALAAQEALGIPQNANENEEDHQVEENWLDLELLARVGAHVRQAMEAAVREQELEQLWQEMNDEFDQAHDPYEPGQAPAPDREEDWRWYGARMIRPIPWERYANAPDSEEEEEAIAPSDSGDGSSDEEQEPQLPDLIPINEVRDAEHGFHENESLDGNDGIQENDGSPEDFSQLSFEQLRRSVWSSDQVSQLSERMELLAGGFEPTDSITFYIDDPDFYGDSYGEDSDSTEGETSISPTPTEVWEEQRMDITIEEENFEPASESTASRPRSWRNYAWIILPLTLLVLIPLARANDLAQQERAILVNRGEILVKGYNACTFALGKTTLDWKQTEGKVPGTWFGTIFYNCSGITGYVESRLECLQGLWWNSVNERIVGCENNVTKLLIGCLLGAILGGLAFWAATLIRDIIMERINTQVITPQGRIEPNAVTWCREPVSNKSPTHASEDETPSIEAPLPPEQPTWAFDQPIAEGSNYDSPRQPARRVQNAPAGNYDVPRGNDDYVNMGAIRLAIMKGLLLILLIGDARAADSTLYISSEGKVCADQQCRSLHTTLTTLSKGSTINFIDVNNTRITLTLERLYQVDNYRLIYVTSDYEITTTSTWGCESASDYCIPGSCSMFSSHYAAKLDGSLPNSTSVSKYGCVVDPMRCNDSKCFYGNVCIHYKWQLRDKGPLGYVFKKTVSYWEASLIQEHQNTTRAIHMSAKDRAHNLHIKDWYTSLPIVAIAAVHMDIPTSEYVLVYKRGYHYVQASDTNLPVKGTIGEYQLSITNHDRVFDVSDVTCIPQDCTAKCFTRTPAFSRFTQNIASSRKPFIAMRLNDIVRTETPLTGSLSLLLTSTPIKGLEYVEADCILTQTNSFACTGCNELGYVTIAATALTSPGIMPFTSNCSFIDNYLPCQQEPFLLYFTEIREYCSIYFPLTNRTLIVKIDAIFKGNLVPITLKNSEHIKAYEILESREFVTASLASAAFIITMGTVVKCIKTIFCI